MDHSTRSNRSNRRTREEVRKGNQITALRFQTGGGRQTSRRRGGGGGGGKGEEGEKGFKRRGPHPPLPLKKQ